MKMGGGGKNVWVKTKLGVKKVWGQQILGLKFMGVNNLEGQIYGGSAQTERSLCAMGKRGPLLGVRDIHTINTNL